MSTARDRRDDSRTLLVVTGALLLAFSVGAAAQSAFVFRLSGSGATGVLEAGADLGIRLLANLTTVAVALASAAVLRLHDRPAPARLLGVGMIAVCVSLLRFWLQLLLRVYPAPSWDVLLPEVASVFLIMSIAFLLGLAQTDARARLRRQERAGARQALRAAAALEELSREELRVRREVAEELHGTVQNRLVLVSAQLAAIIERQRAAGAAADDIERLAVLRADIDDIRERDVRGTSQLLYPAGVGLGVAHAIRLLVQRISPTIATDVVIGAGLSEGDQLGVDRRVLLARAAEEAITNALKHGSAGHLRLELVAEPSGSIRLTIEDDGLGLGSGDRSWSGLARLADRVRALGGELSLDSGRSRGAVLRVTVPAAE